MQPLFWLAEMQLVWSFCLKMFFLLELVRTTDFSEHTAAIQCICICGLCSFCPPAGFFFSLVCKLAFFECWTKVPECLHYTNLYLASWICSELRKQWRAAGWAAVAAHGACPPLTLSPGPRDAWQMEAWHSAPAGYTRLSPCPTYLNKSCSEQHGHHT